MQIVDPSEELNFDLMEVVYHWASGMVSDQYNAEFFIYQIFLWFLNQGLYYVTLSVRAKEY